MTDKIDPSTHSAPDRGFDRARVAASGADAEAPSGPMLHRTEGVATPVEELSGTAAAEATGKLQVDNEAPPEATAGSG